MNKEEEAIRDRARNVGYEAANPIHVREDEETGKCEICEWGFDKRETIAKDILAGIVPKDIRGTSRENKLGLVREAIEYADLLLEELVRSK